MNTFLTYLFIGMGVGAVIAPLGIGFYSLIKNTKIRREIKRKLARNEFLQPLDVRDYDSEKWKDKINIEENTKQLNKLDEKVFKRGQPTESTN